MLVLIAADSAHHGCSLRDVNKWLGAFCFADRFELVDIGLRRCLALIIALLTVSFQSMKAALANPVKSLRSE